MITDTPHLFFPLDYQRRRTREVKVGAVGIGGHNPIRVQSMLTSFTRDTQSCIDELKRLDQAGCEIARITIPNRRDLETIPQLRARMREEGLNLPLVADIHFAPHLAVDACEVFEKVRINPGNFSDRPKNSDKQKHQAYDMLEGRERMAERLKPLLDKLKYYQSALRIGVNHGSLSTRMITHYGDSPRGMVESALEVLQILEGWGFYDSIISLKSSNPLVVQRAYTLMANALDEQRPAAPTHPVPFHLGVTEAGDGYMGRIKGMCGIGALLADGIGDTIRVSLTEPSENEVIFAKYFLQRFDTDYVQQQSAQTSGGHQEESATQQQYKLELPLEAARVLNPTCSIADCTLGGGSAVKVGIFSAQLASEEDQAGEEHEAHAEWDWDFRATRSGSSLTFSSGESVLLQAITPALDHSTPDHREALLACSGDYSAFALRRLYQQGGTLSAPLGIFIEEDPDTKAIGHELHLSRLIGNGLVDFIAVSARLNRRSMKWLFSLLQATRVKLSETDYIACPSCGRTLFNIQETVAKVKARTNHLKGVKIGVMGCIVNGPGEMADADFGYVGAGTGKIDLYLGHQRIRKNIREAVAVEELVALIKSEGAWVEPPSPEGAA